MITKIFFSTQVSKENEQFDVFAVLLLDGQTFKQIFINH